jgi:hypothetical protein
MLLREWSKIRLSAPVVENKDIMQWGGVGVGGNLTLNSTSLVELVVDDNVIIMGVTASSQRFT